MQSHQPQSDKDILIKTPVQYQLIEGLQLAYRRCGSGPSLVFLHAWPLNGLTYRHLVDKLADRFSCYVLDLPGAGDSAWSDQADLTPRGQADLVRQLLRRLGIERYSIVAGDSGGMIARYLAAADAQQVAGLVLLNTEIPFHRAPFLPEYKRLSHLPGFTFILRALLKSSTYRRSRLGFGNVFHQRHLVDGEFMNYFLRPLIESKQNTRMAIESFRAITTWSQVDELDQIHPQLQMPTFFIWGADDTTFPEDAGRRMAQSIPGYRGFHSIARAKLFAQEERPAEVTAALRDFLAEVPV